MFKRILSTLIVFVGLSLYVNAQKIADLTISVKDLPIGISIPVNINLDDITHLPVTEIALVEVQGRQRIEIPYQIENKGQRILYWSVNQETRLSKKNSYELIHRTPKQIVDPVQISKESGVLVISSKHKNLLQYNYSVHNPPAGVDTAFRRSGFIHPLWTPNGQELTRINAADHYHHYGLWNPWTKVLFEGEIFDFWNLKDRKGTVRFSNFVSINTGQIYGEYQTVHEHVAFTKKGEKAAINELQTVRVYQADLHQNLYLLDITIQLNCASDSPVVLKEYRYGGLGWRATEKWNKDNSKTLTSEGKNRKEADGSKARWVIVQGSLDQDYGGALMMSYPSNYNHPEPLRIWPEDSNGKGDVFANFSPTKDKDWVLTPGNNYVLKYRLMVFNGGLSKEKAEAAWQSFAYPVKVSVNF